MTHSDNCLNMHVSHVQWYEDSLLFFFGKSKTNPTGEKSNEPWHVYANPHNPFICPVLALSKYLLSNADKGKMVKILCFLVHISMTAL